MLTWISKYEYKCLLLHIILQDQFWFYIFNRNHKIGISKLKVTKMWSVTQAFNWKEEHSNPSSSPLFNWRAVCYNLLDWSDIFTEIPKSKWLSVCMFYCTNYSTCFVLEWSSLKYQSKLNLTISVRKTNNVWFTPK